MEYVVIRSHNSTYPDPISLRRGDVVAMGRRDDRYPGWVRVTTSSGREGWAPESMIRTDERGLSVATGEYTARELDTKKGERLVCTRELAGWLWVENGKGESGWIPRDTVRAT